MNYLQRISSAAVVSLLFLQPTANSRAPEDELVAVAEMYDPSCAGESPDWRWDINVFYEFKAGKLLVFTEDTTYKGNERLFYTRWGFSPREVDVKLLRRKGKCKNGDDAYEVQVISKSGKTISYSHRAILRGASEDGYKEGGKIGHWYREKEALQLKALITQLASK